MFPHVSTDGIALAAQSIARLRNSERVARIEQTVREMWKAGRPVTSISRETGLTVHKVWRMADDLRLPPRQRSAHKNREGLTPVELDRFDHLVRTTRYRAAFIRLLILAARERGEH